MPEVPDPSALLRKAGREILLVSGGLYDMTGPTIDDRDFNEDESAAVERIFSAAAELRRQGLWLMAEADLRDGRLPLKPE